MTPTETPQRARRLPAWYTLAPLIALVALAFVWGRKPNDTVLMVVGLLLGAAVLAAVHHAEVVAHRVGEPYGSLILAVCVTVIEVGLIVVLMTAGGPGTETLARDTVFAAVMITTNGIVGISLIMGAVRHGLLDFNTEGSAAAMSTVLLLATVCLVLPTFTSVPGPVYTGAQLAFAAVASLALYLMFVSGQTRHHRNFFLPVDENGAAIDEDHADPPSGKATLASLALLVIALVCVVGLAKVLSPAIEQGVTRAGLPHAFVGVVIALLVLAPETLAAVRAARRARVQTSLNLAFGSAMASIGLTIPVIAVLSLWLEGPLHLGLGGLHMALLAVTAVVSVLTIVPGRATRMQGGLHLVMLAAYLFLAAKP